MSNPNPMRPKVDIWHAPNINVVNAIIFSLAARGTLRYVGFVIFVEFNRDAPSVALSSLNTVNPLVKSFIKINLSPTDLMLFGPLTPVSPLKSKIGGLVLDGA